jgi:hypothetical protein
MRKEILASVALAALLAAAPAWAQSSSGAAPAAPAQTERSDAAKTDAAKTDATKPADADRPAGAAAPSGTAAGSSATSSGTTAGSAATSGGRSTAAGSSEAPKAGVITAQQQDQLTAENLIGMDVRNPQDEKIGTIEDLVLSSDMRVEGIVVSVGGFLGLGKHDVALTRCRSRPRATATSGWPPST